MPARFGFAAAKAGECGFLFLRGPFRRITRIKTDEDHFVVAAGVEGKHAQRANHTLLHLIAEHGAAVIDERQDHGLPVKVVAKLDAAAGFVLERNVKGHLAAELGLEAHVLQSAGHGRGRRAHPARSGLRR